MTWNYRILAHKYKEEVELQIHEVYYNEDGQPNGYTQNPVSVHGDSIESINLVLNKMLECKNKPILWAGDKFPNEIKIKYTCELCGRNNFDKPIPHNCVGGFRKRRLKWIKNYI